MKQTEQPINIRLSEQKDAIIILDQTRLPLEERYVTLHTAEEFFCAIHSLMVRGAPAIGIFAAYASYLMAKQIDAQDAEEFYSQMHKQNVYLQSSRPTAVNLSWALQRMEQVVRDHMQLPIPQILNLLEEECRSIHQEDMDMCRLISEHGLTLLKEGCGVLTHCNAGPLATSQYGTALGPILLAKERGVHVKVYADETRPLLQGARLTAYELMRAGVDVTLICDNMAATVMKNGWVQLCFVGCDRIAANGDTANKIGTLGVAILAKYYGIPFYVLGPSSTIDLSCKSGEDILIEQRDPQEIKQKFYQHPMAPEAVACYNPAFDVTDHSLITGIITEKGILTPPYEKSLKNME